MSTDVLDRRSDEAADPNLRLLALSDGVMAVAITLLVLDIRLPGNVAELTDAELWASLVSIWPRFLAYALSFTVIASYWFSHRRKFEVITRRSVVLDWLNIVYLLTIGLIPFVTGVIAENGGAAATALYAGVAALTSVVGAVMSTYALQAGLASDGDVLKRSRAAALLMAAVFVVSMPLGFINADAAKLFWIVLWPASALLRRSKRTATGRSR